MKNQSDILQAPEVWQSGGTSTHTHKHTPTHTQRKTTLTTLHMLPLRNRAKSCMSLQSRNRNWYTALWKCIAFVPFPVTVRHICSHSWLSSAVGKEDMSHQSKPTRGIMEHVCLRATYDTNIGHFLEVKLGFCRFIVLPNDDSLFTALFSCMQAMRYLHSHVKDTASCTTGDS